MLTALSLFIPYILGLGLLTLLISPEAYRQAPRTGQDSARLLALILILGILSNYAVILIVQRLYASMLTGCILALLGLISAGIILKRETFLMFRLDWVSAAVVLYLIALFAIPILFIPLQDWDARSIWFYHGKMIFYADALSPATGLNGPGAGFSHVSYPELAPVLAAQFSRSAGFWNEYAPKAGLLVLLVPAGVATTALFDRFRISSAFLIAFFFFSFGWWLWNGYMDGYLALYSALSSLFFARWLDTGHPLDALMGIACAALAASLKNEGMFFALVLLVSLAALLFLFRKKPLLPSLARRWDFWALTCVCFLGVVLWTVKTHVWGLGQETDRLALDAARISERIAHGAIPLTVQALLIKAPVAMAVGFLLTTLAVARAFRVRAAKTVWLPVVAATIYFAGMFIIYLNTPNELAWHLATSADRTMLVVIYGFISATFLILRDLERPVPDPLFPGASRRGSQVSIPSNSAKHAQSRGTGGRTRGGAKQH